MVKLPLKKGHKMH